MSKLRQQVPTPTDELSMPPIGDLSPYVVFTQLKEGGPHLYAGWVDAVDDDMALQFAREHYGQDQVCVNIWAFPKNAIISSETDPGSSPSAGGEGEYRVFVQKEAGEAHVSCGTVPASSGIAAWKAARTEHPEASHANSLWIVGVDDVLTTGEHDLIWRNTDQTYRLARGYSKDVREKWEKVRALRDLEKYERDDLKEAF